MKPATAERVSFSDLSDNYVFQRSLLAYRYAAGIAGGRVLEIGTGSGYGIRIISPSASHFLTVDKHAPDSALVSAHENVEFRQMNVPPITSVADGSMDCVISFQVIEHIADDREFVEEVYRVLRKGGVFVVSTPNRPMSLTRNPWHVREYTADELQALLSTKFGAVECNGVFGNEKIMEYYRANAASVEKIARWDFLDLQHRLPRRLLQLPYDLLNRINRRKLLKANTSLTESITSDDYFVAKAGEGCFDLLFIARK